MDQEKIGKFLMYLRREKKLTQAQLAEKLNVSDKTISKWERGVCLPEMNTIDLIIKFYGITLMEFYAGERNSLLSDKFVNETTKNVVETNNKSLIKKYKRKIISFMVIMLIILLTITSIFMINTYGKYSEFEIVSSCDKYSADGNIMIAKEKSYITLLNINITDEELASIKSHSFEYELSLDNILIERKGDIYSNDIKDYITLSNYLKNVSIYINHDLSDMIHTSEIEKKFLILRIKYLDSNDNETILEFKFNFKNNFKNNSLYTNKNYFL